MSALGPLAGDVATVQTDNFAGQRQPPAGSGHAVDPFVLGTVEFVEDALKVVRADPDARVHDFD